VYFQAKGVPKTTLLWKLTPRLFSKGDEMKSVIRLFKALPIQAEKEKQASRELMLETMRRGFILSPEVVANYPDIKHVISLISEEYGLTAEQLNASFHKSWEKVKNASIEQLVLEQILHYFTTYGFEFLGIYDKDSVYIPREKLEIPLLDIDGFSFVVIKGYTNTELKDKLMTLLKMGVALKDQTIKDVVDVATFVGITEKDIESINNRETKITLYEYLNILPSDPIEFLRYLIYKTTGQTLLIKNKKTIEAIKENTSITSLSLYEKYAKTYGLERLGEVFYRFKPLFLAFKGKNMKLNKYINKTRKLAPTNHKPMKKDYLNTITEQVKNLTLNDNVFKNELNKASIFRKIRLAYALKYRTKPVDSILYKVRNERSYVTAFNFDQQLGAELIYNHVYKSIVEDLEKTVKGKKIYIPENVTYALPATEKQFTGNLPSGTCVTIPHDMVFGVYWDNVGHNRIDLDLSLMNSNIGKIGWDRRYRTEGREVLFSGDVTDSTHGASELFYVQRQGYGNYIMHVNYYNYDKDIPVPFKIIVAEEKPRQFSNNYTVNPNHVKAISKSTIDQKQTILGLLETTPEECKFYYVQTSIGRSITSRSNEQSEQSRKYLFNYYTDTLSLNEALRDAGTLFVKNKDEAEIDLSIETLERDTIFNLIYDSSPTTKIEEVDA